MKYGVIIGMVVFGLLSGCIENEESFYIEHVKALPEYPDCEYSAGDPVAPFYHVDLYSATQVSGIFYVTNAVMIKNDYGNLVAESNGILVDGYEVYTDVPGEGAVGGREFFEYNHFIPPETSEVLMAQLISPNAIAELKDFYCQDVDVPAIAIAIAEGDMDMLEDVTPSRETPETMQSVVRYLGHTQGGVELETQEFSFTLYTYCGPQDGWEPCFENPCYALCSDATYATSCFPGVNAINTCAAYLAGYGGTIMVDDPTNDDPDAPMVTYCQANCGG